MNKSEITDYFPIPIIIGFVIWLLSVCSRFPFSPYADQQVYVLLLAAPLFLLPLCLHLSDYSKKKLWLVLSAAILFAFAFHLPKGKAGMLLVLPWFSIAVYETILCWRDCLTFTIVGIVRMAAFIFWVIAASWALPDRLGYSSLDYDPLIILLTLVHFHYAGFILLHLFLFALPYWSRRIGLRIAALLLTGMPLVAVGISATQVGLTTFIESLSVTIMVSGGIGVALGYLYLGWGKRAQLSGWLWLLSGASLFCGMCLALLYGWRFHHQYAWLSVPWMYAVHGTLNSMGFAFPGVLAWALYTRTERKTAD